MVKLYILELLFVFFKEEKIWKVPNILDRIAKRMEGWKSRFLSNVGKAPLIRSVIQSFPAYQMSTFLLPNNVCKKADEITILFFLWGSHDKRNDLPLKKLDDINLFA